jgi:hypothetical protein
MPREKLPAFVLGAVVVVIAGMLFSRSCRERWYLTSLYWSKTQPIRFWGQVVDQQGKPIGNAKVSILVSAFNAGALAGSNHYLKEQRTTCTTDANGKFELKDVRGTVLNIEKISASGYAPIPAPGWHTPDFAALGYGYSRERGVPYYVPDPDKPAVFPLCKDGEQRVLWPSRGGKDEPNPWDKR